MARRTSAVVALALSAAGLCLAARTLLFAAAPSHGQLPRRSLSAQQRGTAAGDAGQGPAPTTTGLDARQLAIAGAAALLVGCGLRSARNATAQQQAARPQRGARVAARALGSIEQFKVFGPEEDPFEIETDKILGVGGQGTVYLCHRQSDPGTKYAVKTIPIWRLLMDPSAEAKIMEIRKETDVLLKIQGHPNVCTCIGCYDAFRPGTSEPQYIMIVMELIDGGELASFIKDGQNYLTEEVAKSVFTQTVLGLKFIHDRQVVHRDLKAENILVCGKELTASTPVKLIDFGVAKAVANSFAKSCVGTTEIMAPELLSAKLMIAPKGQNQAKHGPYTFKPPAQMSPGFGIITQRPDGKGAMVNGIEPGGQAEKNGVGDGWAISHINGVEILEMPFIKDFNEIGAGTKSGVTAIAEILGSLSADFTMEFIELPKREFNEKVDIWSLGCTLYLMLTGVTPFTEEPKIVNAEYAEGPLAHCSAEAKDLIKRLLVLDPDARPTLDQLLAHPWVGKPELASATAPLPPPPAPRAPAPPPAPAAVAAPAAPPAAPAPAAAPTPAPTPAPAPPPPPLQPPAPAPAAGSAGGVSVGQKVTWNGKAGTVRFVGAVKFASGDWVGVELDNDKGMHDGTVMGVQYFTCPPAKGIFAQPGQLVGGAAPAPAAAAPAAAPSAAAPSRTSISLGQKVTWSGKTGTVRYVGGVKFAPGEWVGVELDADGGMHNGTVLGVQYFECAARRGIFAQPSQLS